jgi:ribosome recycling factor
MSLPDQAKKEMVHAIDHLKEELSNIRTGRASPGLLNSIQVEVYGTAMPLRDVASITAPEAQQLVVSPFDPQNCNAIAKAIDRANLGVRGAVDGHVVRVNIPPMDEAGRKEKAKQVGKKCEEAKVSIRNSRRKFNDTAREQKSSGDIPEDLLHKFEKEIQKLTDDHCSRADDISKEKEKEILSI